MVDGSLRDSIWYFQYFNSLRQSFPKLKIAIMQVTADEESIINRAKRRGKITGRVVPDIVIRNTIAKIPESMALLSPLADVVVVFANEEEQPLKLVHMSQKTAYKECTAQPKSVFYDSNWSEDEPKDNIDQQSSELAFEAFRNVW